MSKVKIIIIVSVTLVGLVVALLFLIKYFKPKKGGLMVNTVPASSVYINGVFIDKTPYKGINLAGQINLKLIPDSKDHTLFPYETKINLVPGIQTVVDREFGESEDTSSGDVISFDKIGGKLAGLTIISTPDNSQVLIDGVSLGSTPYNFNSITTGVHTVALKSEGYMDRTLKVKTVEGLRLSVFVKLAKGGNTPPSPTPKAQEDARKGFVTIKDTPTGFLRMRTEPGAKGEEIAELKPGQKYTYLETDLGTGWFKIQYQEPAPGLPNGIVGWISNQYSSLSITSSSISSPTPTLAN